MLLKKSLHLVSILRGIFCVQYFAGSLANPKIMAGRDNRNASGMSPFEQYTQNTQGMGSDNYTFLYFYVSRAYASQWGFYFTNNPESFCCLQGIC
jgi:hypothetical protein